MSLYTSQSHFGQPQYSHYSQPVAHNGYPYPQPAPPPLVYHQPHQLNPEAFRREYNARLSELNVNSRPIIQNLSMLAQEYSRYAEIVAQCLEAHIRRVPPWMKLPALYLLDAMSKNVYEPYARVFSRFVLPLFLEAYGQVDENTRSKMEEMLLTWRTGNPQGKELFGVAPQVAIERGVWGDGGSSHNSSGFYSGSGHITKAQVLSELEFTLGQKERALQSNPYDATSQGHVNVLQQLRRLVEAGVSQGELHQILAQLRNLVRPQAPQLAPPPPVTHTNWQPQAAYSAPPPNQPPFPTSASYPDEGVKIENLHAPLPPPSTSTPTPAVVPPLEIANLLSTLLKAGVVSASGTLQGAGATAKEEAAQQKIVQNDHLEREASRAYRQAVLSQPVKLTSADITRRRPQIVELLYDQLAAQCKQCGIRFSDTVTGKKNMEDHLDMHFRQNRKANQNIGRGHSRSWFVGIEDWVHDSTSAKGKGRADGVRRLNPRAAAAAEVAKRDAELRAMFVVVPNGAEAVPVSCPICKETLNSEFFEDTEDWVWKNAVMKDERVFHATCHAEAVLSTNSLAARLRSEIATGRSRSATPEASVLRTTPPPSTLRDSNLKSPSLSPTIEAKLAGTKRKVDPNDSTVPGEANGTPPFKKLALSPLSAPS